MKIALKKTILLWLAGFFFGAAMILGCFYYIFFTKWTGVQPVIIAIYVAVMVALFFISLYTNYYEVYKKHFIIHKFGKEYQYSYSDIIYIDKEYSEKKKTILFATKYGHVRFVTFDQYGVLYNTMIDQCQNLMTKEEAKTKNPTLKI